MAATPTVRPDAVSDQHRLLVVGYLHGSGPSRRVRHHPVRVELPCEKKCQRPLLWACEHGCCLAVRPCGNRRESRCTPCATRYRRRVTRIAESGLMLPVRNLTGFQYLTTLNPPGDPGHRRWHPGRRGRHERCDCHVARAAGDASWNASAGKRWNHFLTTLRRLHPSVQFFRAAEVQKRGLLHQHLLLWSETDITPGEVQAAALVAGFGCVMDHQHVTSPQQAARYLAKYVGKSTDQRPDVPWERIVIDDQGVVLEVKSQPTYRSYSQSRQWGLTMRDCLEVSRRAAAIAAARREQDEDPSPEGSPLPAPAANAAAPPG